LRNEREAGNTELWQTFIERTERREKEERRQKVNESRYNSYYKRIITENTLKYLEGRKKGKDRCLIARYRCGNETRGSQHWREEEDRKCRICGGGRRRKSNTYIERMRGNKKRDNVGGFYWRRRQGSGSDERNRKSETEEERRGIEEEGKEERERGRDPSHHRYR